MMLLALLLACQAPSPTSSQGPVPSGLTADTGADLPDLSQILVPGDVSSVVGAWQRDQLSRDYVAPSADALAHATRVGQALAAGRWREVEGVFALQQAEGSYLGWSDPGVGVLVALTPTRALLLEAPHAGYDSLTAEEGASLLLVLGAAGLVVSRAHRCSSERASPCSGSTSVCGSSGPYRLSDAAHAEGTSFHALHLGLAQAWPQALVVSLHGFGWSEGEPVAYVSDGTDVVGSSISRDFVTALAPAIHAASCNNPDDVDVVRLCGTTNLQGRQINGSEAVCERSATVASGHFLHLEQSLALRGLSGPLHRGLVADALAALVPGG